MAMEKVDVVHLICVPKPIFCVLFTTRFLKLISAKCQVFLHKNVCGYEATCHYQANAKLDNIVLIIYLLLYE